MTDANDTNPTETNEQQSCIDFPCEFPIKAMGTDGELVEKTLLDAVERHAPDSPRDNIERRDSRTGKYKAVTVTITADNKEQLDNIYQELTDSEHITMAL